MNERVRELANKAGYNDQIYEISKEGLEKLAELIVLKCAEIADTAEPFLASDLIKQHFGVE